MTKSNAIYVGTEVHKESIGIALAEGGARGAAMPCTGI